MSNRTRRQLASSGWRPGPISSPMNGLLLHSTSSSAMRRFRASASSLSAWSVSGAGVVSSLTSSRTPLAKVTPTTRRLCRSFLGGDLDAKFGQGLGAVFLVIDGTAAYALGGDGGGFVVGAARLEGFGHLVDPRIHRSHLLFEPMQLVLDLVRSPGKKRHQGKASSCVRCSIPQLRKPCPEICPDFTELDRTRLDPLEATT